MCYSFDFFENGRAKELWRWVSKSEKASVAAAFDGLALLGLAWAPFFREVEGMCSSPVLRVPTVGPLASGAVRRPCLLHFEMCTASECM